MKIIIAGAGKVGFSLAKSLSAYHDIIVIDSNNSALHQLQEKLDIQILSGNIEDPRIYLGLQGEKIDLFIAVTDSDEANILSSLIISDMLIIDKKIIRLKNSFFSADSLQERLDIDQAVFPNTVTAEIIGSLLEFPLANNIKGFEATDAKLVSVRVSREEFDSDNAWKVVAESKGRFAIVGIERAGEFFVPKDHSVLLKGDLLHLFGWDEETKHFCKLAESGMLNKIKRCAVFGANDLGIEIARSLAAKNRRVKIIDIDADKCENALEILHGQAQVIQSRYDIHHLFNSELKGADMLIATGERDEFNIVKCLEARQSGIPKTVAIINEPEYYSMAHSLDLIVARGAKTNAFYTILEKLYSEKVIAHKIFCGGKAAILLRKILPGSRLSGKERRPAASGQLKQTISFVIDNRKRRIVTGDYRYQEGDAVIAVCPIGEVESAKEWIRSL